jgi:hypothetical protein
MDLAARNSSMMTAVIVWLSVEVFARPSMSSRILLMVHKAGPCTENSSCSVNRQYFSTAAATATTVPTVPLFFQVALI